MRRVSPHAIVILGCLALLGLLILYYWLDLWTTGVALVGGTIVALLLFAVVHSGYDASRK